MRDHFKDSGADVAVLVRGGVVTVQVKRPVVLVLVVVTAHVQHNAGAVVVAVVALRTETPVLPVQISHMQI